MEDAGPALPLFSAETTSIKTFTSVLTSIQFQKEGLVQVDVESDGMYLVINELNYLQAIAYFPASLFKSFDMRSDEPIVFSVSTMDLLSGLTLFGASVATTISLEYEAEGSPLNLKLHLASENARASCKINTSSTVERRYNAFGDVPPISKLITNPDLLLGVLSEVDWNSGVITVTFSATEPLLVISSTGGESVYTIEMGNASFIEKSFEFDNRTLQYKSNLIQSAMKPLHHAKKVSLRMNGEGILALQYLIRDIDYNTPNSYIDFYVAPLITEE